MDVYLTEKLVNSLEPCAKGMRWFRETVLAGKTRVRVTWKLLERINPRQYNDIADEWVYWFLSEMAELLLKANAITSTYAKSLWDIDQFDNKVYFKTFQKLVPLYRKHIFNTKK